MKFTNSLIKISTLTLGLVVASSAFAAAQQVDNGDIVQTGGDTCVDATDRILTGPVPLNLSKNVSVSYECHLADATVGTVNHVNIGGCNIGGTAKARDVQCQVNPSDPTGATFTPAGCADATSTIPLTGIAFFWKSTAGGPLIEESMGTTSCNTTGIVTIVDALE